MIPTNPSDDPYKLLAEEPQIVTAIRKLIQRSNTSTGQSANEGGADSRSLNDNIRDLSFNATLTSSGDTLTLTPTKSGVMPLYGDDGDGWNDFVLEAAITLSTAGYTSGSMYDIFYFYDQSQDTPILTLYTIIWASETARTTDLTVVDGVSLLSSDTHYRYLATGRYNGSTMLVPTIDPNGELFFGTGNPRDNVSNPFSGVGMSAAGVTFGSYVWQFFAAINGAVGVGFNALGQLLAGAGVVILDATGISMVVPGIYSTLASYKFMQGTHNVGEFWMYDGVTTGAFGGVRIKSSDASEAENCTASLGSLCSSGYISTTSLLAQMKPSGGIPSGRPVGVDLISEPTGGNSRIVLNPYSEGVYVIVNGSGGEEFRFTGGCLGIGTPTPSEALDVVGNIKASGTIAAAGNVTGANLSGTNTGNQTIKSNIGGNGMAGTVALSSTAYLGYFVSSAPMTAEVNANIRVSAPGTLLNLRVRTLTAQPASGSLVVTLRVNASDTAVTFTVAAGAAAAEFTDLTHSASITAGQTAVVKVVNNATAASAQIGGWCTEFDAS